MEEMYNPRSCYLSINLELKVLVILYASTSIMNSSIGKVWCITSDACEVLIGFSCTSDNTPRKLKDVNPSGLKIAQFVDECPRNSLSAAHTHLPHWPFRFTAA